MRSPRDPSTGPDIPFGDWPVGPVNRERGVLMVAAVLSFAAHVVAAWWVHDRPVAHLDPLLVGLPLRTARVRLVELQPDPFRPGPENEQVASGNASIAPDLQTLSELMLDPNSPSTHLSRLPEIQTDPMVESRPVAQPRQADSVPQVTMPSSVQRALIGRLPLDVAFVAVGASSRGAGNGSRPDRGAGSATVQQLLDQMDVAAMVDRSPEFVEGPSIADSPMIERPRPQTSVARDQIDFVDLALQSTTRLVVPEHLDNDFDYELTVHHPAQGPAYFRADVTARRSLVKLRAMPKDIVILIDTSGSVPQRWVKAVTVAVQDGLSSLNLNDRFNIMLFKQLPVFFNSEFIQPYTVDSLAAARKFLSGAHSGGYTNVNDALARLMVRDVAVDRVYDLVLISDGRPTRGVLDTRELLNRITRDNNLAASIYCVGVGGRQNHKLLDFLAYRNRGTTRFVTRVEASGPAIRDLLSRLRYPILKEVQLDVAGLPDTEVYPQNLPNIHQSERFPIFGRFDPRGSGKLTVRVRGLNHGRVFDFTFQRDLRQARQGDKQIARDWAFHKLHHLYSELLQTSNLGPVKKQIDRLSKEFKLDTLY